MYEDTFKDNMKQKGEILFIRKQLEADNQLNPLGPYTWTEVHLNSINGYSSGK